MQILHNLVGNSCKFTKTGHVLIGVRYDSTLRAIALSVSDTGCGIPTEALHTVFDAWSQGLHRTSEGLGLGLHLVVEFVKAHHGLIEVRPGHPGGPLPYLPLPLTLSASLSADLKRGMSPSLAAKLCRVGARALCSVVPCPAALCMLEASRFRAVGCAMRILDRV